MIDAPRHEAASAMQRLLGAPRALIGMLHLRALPGAPRHAQSLDEIAATAVGEARLYREHGFDALMIENMHDLPYLRGAVPPETVAAMTAVGREVRREVPLPLGVQVLAGANREALAVAHACGATFIRAEAFVFAHVADEGWLEACAGPLLRARRAMGADGVAIFADVKKKHAAHAVTADVSLAETARAAVFNLADGVIVTGTATGEEARTADVAAVAAAVRVPVLVGSGLTPENLPRYPAADGFIVGSSVKESGVWSNPLDAARVRAVAEAFRSMARAR
jgi:membrane complex biogenesis BtpA family protein